MDLYQLLRLAKDYAHLGWAVQEQLDTLLEQGEDAEINSNARRMIEEWATRAIDAGVEDADVLVGE